MSLSSEIVPPCLLTMPRLTQSPRPVPRSPFVVKKGWKRWGRTSSAMPGPLSAMVTVAPACIFWPVASTPDGLRRDANA